MTVRRIGIRKFKAHCTEEIRGGERGDVVLELTRNGKTVVVIQPPPAMPSAPTLADWVGGENGTVAFGPGYDPSGPAFDPSNWER